MAVTPAPRTTAPPHPAHAFLLGATVPLFLGAGLCDWAYASSFHVQWINFASWLITGGLLFAFATLVCALLAVVRPRSRGPAAMLDFAIVLAMCVLGVVNALVHARDAWASMPTGLVLSLILALLACAASGLAFARLRAGGAP